MEGTNYYNYDPNRAVVRAEKRGVAEVRNAERRCTATGECEMTARKGTGERSKTERISKRCAHSR